MGYVFLSTKLNILVLILEKNSRILSVTADTKTLMCWVWWCISVIPAPGKVSQED
jgi:hypothetical protein